MAKTRIKKETAKKGDLRVWWVHEAPGNACLLPVMDNDLRFAVGVIDTLTRLDEHMVVQGFLSGDVANAGGLSVFDGQEWIDWHDADGRDIDECRDDILAGRIPKWEYA